MAQTRILAIAETVDTGPAGGWNPNGGAAVAAVNSIDVSIAGGSSISSFNGHANSRKQFSTTDLPVAANGATILSVDCASSGRRAGGGAGTNYNTVISDRLGIGGEILSAQHNVPFAVANPPGFTIFNDNFPTDPNGNVWQYKFINSTFEIGVHQGPAPATGCAVYFLDYEVLWAGDTAGWIAVGISLLLPFLLPILGDMNLQHLTDNELAQLHWITKKAAYEAGETTFPSVVLREEREKLISALSRPTYGI